MKASDSWRLYGGFLWILWVESVGLGNVVIVNANVWNIAGIAAWHVAIDTSFATPHRFSDGAVFQFAFVRVWVVAANTRLIESLLIRFLYAHMGVVAVYAGKIDVGVVLVEVALVGTFEALAHLESLRVSGHYKCRIALVGWHIYRKNGVKVHAWTEVGEFFARFKNVISLQVTALANINLKFPRQALGVYDRPIGVFSGVYNDAIRFFLYMQ